MVNGALRPSAYGRTFADVRPGQRRSATFTATTFKAGLKRMCQWLRDNGLPIAWVYTHENPQDEKPNTHLLVHVPPRLRRAFKAKVSDWFQALDGGVLAEPRNDAQRRRQGKTTRLQYMAKGGQVSPGSSARQRISG